MDTLGNLLTSIRNAELASHSKLLAPASRQAADVLRVLQEYHYISAFETTENEGKKMLSITLATPLVRHHYKRLSKPGRRSYVGVHAIPYVLRGKGIVILSTSKGILAGKQAKEQQVGGELICEVY